MARLLGRWLIALLVAALLAGCSDDASNSDDESSADLPDLPGSVTVTFGEGGVVAGVGGTTLPVTSGCNALDQEDLDIVHHTWTIPGEHEGTPVKVGSLTLTLRLMDPSLLDADMDLVGPDGQLLGQTMDFNVQTGPTETLLVESGLTPGDYTIAVRGCSGRGAYGLNGEAIVHPVVEAEAVAAPAA